jgi:TPR repeat protein
MLMRLVAAGLAATLTIGGAAAARFEDGLAAANRNDYTTAYRLWLPLAEAGEARAQLYVGLLHEQGRGVGQAYATAVKWYRKAALQGLPRAQYHLAVMYENRLGISEDFPIAQEWYRRAAEQGDALAQNNLGLMFRDGRGGPVDPVVAVMWFTLAAAQGHTGAAINRAETVKLLRPAELAQAEQLARDWKPASLQ